MRNIIKNGNSNATVEQYRMADNLAEYARQLEQRKKEHPEDYPVSEPDPFDLAVKQSEEILMVAREQAVKIKEEAHQEGYDAGFIEGRDDGFWQAHNEQEKKEDADRELVLAQVQECIAEMEEQKKRLLEQHLNDLRDIAVAIAEKVMRVSLQSSGDIIKRMIVSATEKLQKTQWVKIYISKYDADMMIEGDAQLLNSLSYLSDNIKIVTMDAEEQGTCIVELPKEIIDVSINTQMENIKDILSNAQL
ncbi:MAG: FliH/SctL family protein [Hungatella sp.]